MDPSDFDVIDEWKGISSKLVIYGPDDIVPDGITPFEITFMGIGNTVTSTPACTCPNGTQTTSAVINWQYVEIHLYVPPSTGGLNGFSEIQRKKVIVHELGHAFKLAHTFGDLNYINVPNGRGGYFDNNSVAAVMNQGIPDTELNLATATPKWHDKINLKNKWD